MCAYLASPVPMPPQRHRGLSGQSRLIQKNKERKVAKYKLFKQYQQVLRKEATDAVPTSAAAAMLPTYILA